jgi:hypothetical protein
MHPVIAPEVPEETTELPFGADAITGDSGILNYRAA